jgi:NDP-sugar pyrophosphorylase family protein
MGIFGGMNMKRVNVVIPMAGRGKRFLDHGYKTPKPLLEVNGKTMIDWVIKSVDFPEAHFIFIVRKDHEDDYGISKLLKSIKHDCDIIVIDKITEGAVCTVLLSEKLINNDNELIVKDCDQIMDWDACHFINFVRRHNAEGVITTVFTQHPGYSFSKLGPDNLSIVEVAEKVVISNIGNAGLYYFAKGKQFVKYANQMIEKNIRTNNEFYISPVYNEFIQEGKLIINYPIPHLYGLNTPEEFERYKDEAVSIFKK